MPGPGGGPGRVYLFGGQEPASGAIFDDLLCLDTSSWELTDVTLEPQQAQQQQQPSQRPPGRHSHVAGLYEGRGLIIFGGAGLRGPLADVWVFQPSSDGTVDGSGTSGTWRCLSDGLAEDEGPERREMVSASAQQCATADGANKPCMGAWQPLSQQSLHGKHGNP